MRSIPFFLFLGRGSWIVALGLAGCGSKTPPPPRLESDASSWSPRNALVLAEAATMAYDRDASEKVKAALRCESCERLSFPIDLPVKFRFEEGEPGPQAILAAGEEHIVIAIRGTEINLVDILTDAWARPAQLAPEVGGKAHGGFVVTFLGLWPDLKEKLALARGKFPGAKLWITGHSLGGGLAVMAAAKIAIVEKIPVQGLITFGAPVCGDREFHQALDAALGRRHWRVVHERDLVTLDLSPSPIPFLSLPPELTRFQHGGTPVWLSSDGTTSIGGDGDMAMSKEALRFGKTWLKSRNWEPPDDLLGRHGIGRGYLPALRKMLERSKSER